jgi:hypothetical protein
MPVTKYSRNGTTLARRLQWAAAAILILAIIALLVVLFSQQQSYRTEAQTVRGGSSAIARPSASAAETVTAGTQAAQNVVNGTSDAVINVLGDSTSDTSTEWVYRWAEDLGADAAVTVHTWNPTTADWFPQTRNYGSGDRAITIWNASAAEADPSVPLANDGMVQPDAGLTILNYGHWGESDSFSTSLDDLLETLDAGSENAAPVLVTAQSPARQTWSDSSDTNRDALRTAAASRGLPVIDVWAAFGENGNGEDLLVDQVNPNEEGHQLWAETVRAFFTC